MPYDYGENEKQSDNQLRGGTAQRMAATGASYGPGLPPAEAQPTIQTRLNETAHLLAEQNKIAALLADRLAVALRPSPVADIPAKERFMEREKSGTVAYLPDQIATLNGLIREHNGRLADLLNRLAL